MSANDENRRSTRENPQPLTDMNSEPEKINRTTSRVGLPAHNSSDSSNAENATKSPVTTTPTLAERLAEKRRSDLEHDTNDEKNIAKPENPTEPGIGTEAVETSIPTGNQESSPTEEPHQPDSASTQSAQAIEEDDDSDLSLSTNEIFNLQTEISNLRENMNSQQQLIDELRRQVEELSTNTIPSAIDEAVD